MQSQSQQNVRFYRNVARTFRVLESISPCFAARCAGRLFSTPIRKPLKEYEVQFLEEGAPLSLSLSGGEIQGWRWGSGPAVLLVHGWSGRAAHFHAIGRELLTRGFSVIAFDKPGHGLSYGRESNLILFNEAIERISKFYGPFVAVVGHSLGSLSVAFTASQFALAEKLVLVSPAIGVNHAVEYFIDTAGISHSLAKLMMGEFQKRYHVDFSSLEISSLGPNLPLETLVFHDQDDHMIPWEETKEWVDRSPSASLQLTQRLGHYKILSDPSIAKRIGDFICPARANIRELFLSEYAL